MQGDLGVARAIEEVKMGLDEDTEDLIVPEWFGGFGDKEVVDKKSEMEPVKDWQSSSGWTRKQPIESKGRKTEKKSQGSSQLIPLTRNKDANKGSGGDDETRPQPAMSIVKRRRKPEKKKGRTFLGEENPSSGRKNPSSRRKNPSTGRKNMSDRLRLAILGCFGLNKLKQQWHRLHSKIMQRV